MNWNALETYVNRFVHEERIPSASIAVMKDGDLIYTGGFGKACPNEHTLYGTASITKSFVAAAVIRLHEEGRLCVHDRVQDYCPEFFDREVTIEQLLTHSTGVPPLERRVDLQGFDEHLQYLRDGSFSRLGAPGEYMSYCNDTFLLLGAIVEKATNMSYFRCIEEFFFKPLGMDRSTFHVEKLKEMTNVSTPYVQDAGEVAVTGWPELGNYAVGGGIRSTTYDVVQFVNELARNEERYGGMWAPRFSLDRYSQYGYGLVVTPDYDGRTVVGHGGSQPGVSSQFMFVPEEKLSLVVLTNLADVDVGRLATPVLHTAFGLPLDKPVNEEPRMEISRPTLERLVGAYRTEESAGMIHIWTEGNQVVAQVNGEREELRASGETTLVIVRSGKPLNFFVHRTENRAWAVRLGMRMYVRA